MALNGVNLQLANPLWAETYFVAAATLVFGVSLAQIYLLIFNRPTRRLLHDLLIGSALVRSDSARVEVPRTPGHANAAVVIIAAVLALSIATASGLFSSLLPSGFRQDLSGLQKPLQAVQALPEVMEAGVQDNRTTFSSTNGTSTTRTLLVNARLRYWPADQKTEVARVRTSVERSYHFEPGQGLRITLTYGFDLGIASGSRSYSDAFAEPSTNPQP